MGNSPEAGSGQSPALAGEQAALRRVATLVARAASQADVFAAVAEEVGRVLHADRTFLTRYNDDGTATLVAAWSAAGEAAPISYHGPLPEGGPAARVQATGHPVRIDRYPDDSLLASHGVRSGVIAPITVGGRLWGFMTAGSVTGQPPPPETEARLAGFTELVAAAIANADAREELRRVADEQAALRRVATLVARAAPSAEVFAAVAEEIGALFGADITSIMRFEANGDATFMGGHGVVWREQEKRFKPYPGTAVTSVRATGRAARLDADDLAAAALPEVFRTEGVRSAVNAPVVVEGTIWGTVGVASRRGRLPVDTEQRLAGFTELVATAIANAQARTELRGFAGEQAALRRVATLVARGALPEEAFAAVAAEVTRVIDVDVSFLSRYARDGTATVVAVSALPSAVPAGTQFDQGGRRAALRALARRSPIPVDLDLRAKERLPEHAEVSAYYIVAEALTNTVRHARASAVSVEVEAVGEVLRVVVRDDGAGGAGFTGGTGLVGLKDRVEALGGRIFLDSPRGAGTSLRVELPLAATDDGTSR